MATPVETAAHLSEYVEPHRAVGIVDEDRLAAVTTRRDVIERVREFETQGTGHEVECRLVGVAMHDLTPASLTPASSSGSSRLLPVKAE